MMLCKTIEEFERQERKERRARAFELLRKGVTSVQVAERLGINERTASRYAVEVRRANGGARA